MYRTIPFWVRALFFIAIGILVDIAISYRRGSQLLNPMLWLMVLCRGLLFSFLFLGPVWLAGKRK